MATKKIKKRRPFTDAWFRDAAKLALHYAPRIGACVECNAPVMVGYCCETCGSGKGCNDEEGNKL